MGRLRDAQQLFQPSHIMIALDQAMDYFQISPWTNHHPNIIPLYTVRFREMNPSRRPILTELEAILILAGLYSSAPRKLEDRLRSLRERGASPVDELLSSQSYSDLQLIEFRRAAQRFEKEGIWWTAWGRDGYPPKLYHRPLLHPWPVLFFKGNRNLLDGLTIGIVGTRRPRAVALNAVQTLAAFLARNNAVVVSGNAPGIDSAAHEGALLAGGRSIFVLPTDIQSFRIRWSRVSCAKPLRYLALSPFPPDQSVHKGHFIRRNELLAGLCDALVVGEAGVRSGAFYAVRAALRNRIPVYVLCDQAGLPFGDGGRALLGQNCRPLTTRPEEMGQMLDLTRREAAGNIQAFGSGEGGRPGSQTCLFNE